jgi:hypothetical protein
MYAFVNGRVIIPWHEVYVMHTCKVGSLQRPMHFRKVQKQGSLYDYVTISLGSGGKKRGQEETRTLT